MIIYLEQFIFLINSNGGIITLISVIIAIITFLGVIIFDRWKHKKKQINLLKSLMSEINILIGERKIDNITIGSHLEWIKNNRITDHLAHKINVNFYNQNLDDTINGKNTSEIIIFLQVLNDKIDLINYYVSEMRGYVYTLWKEESKENYDDWVKKFDKDKFIILFNSKLNSPVHEAIKIANKIKCIIKERFLS